MEGRGVQSHHAREHVREEPLGVPEKGPFALQAAELLEEGQRQHLRVREPLERAVGIGAVGVEEVVSVVDEAEEHGQSLFQASCRWSSVWVGHPRFLSLGSRMAPFLPAIHATDI